MRNTGSNYSSSSPWAIKGILITLFIIFIIQNITRHWFDVFWFEQYLALSVSNLSKGLIYTPISYGLLHSTDNALPWHFILNALFIWWFGKEIEQKLGSAKFIDMFFFSIFIGGLIWAGLRFLSGSGGTLVGASAGAYGVLYLFCRQFWFQPMQFLFIPFQLNGKILFYIIIGFQLFFFLFAELPQGRSGTAYSAHLGGVFGAFLFERYLISAKGVTAFFLKKPSIEIVSPQWEKKVQSVKSKSKNPFKINLKRSKTSQAEVDRILDKINAKGFGALTEDEKKTLDRAKDDF